MHSFGKPLGAVLGSLLLLSACTPPRYQAEYWFIDHLAEASVLQEADGGPATQRFEIGYDQRRVLLQPPPSTYHFTGVPSGPEAVLAAAPVMDPGAWSGPSNGVRFEARCRGADGGWLPLLELEISPASRPRDRVWHDRRMPLDACAQPSTDIELRTTCGPGGDCRGDAAGWGSPRVTHDRSLVLRPERLALLISIDTLRPDRLGLYGAPRATSPQLERLAEDAIVFDTVVAPSPWTIPSHATLLTSTDPRVHGADKGTRIADATVLVSEVLRRAGWQTAGFVDTSFLSRKFGFERGFERYDDGAAPKGDYRRGGALLRQRLLDWLEAADERPAFGFWHIMDVHGPYEAAAPFAGRFRSSLPLRAGADPRLERLKKLALHDYLKLERFSSLDDLVATYDEGIASVDDWIGGLLQILRDVDLYDDALIVVTSDHGESLLDHGLWVGHGLFLTDDEVRVPLIVKLPGNRRGGTRVADLAGLIDVGPTMLDALDLPTPAAFEGRSLLAATPESPSRAVFGFSSNIGAGSLRTQNLKYIGPAHSPPERLVRSMFRPKGGVPTPAQQAGEQLYDLVRDPRETTPLTGPQTEKALTALRGRLAQHAAACAERREGAEPALELSEEERARLRALGYADSDSSASE